MRFRTDIPLFCDFFDQYGERINAMNEVDDNEILIVTPEMFLASTMFYGKRNEYFLCNGNMRPKAVGYNAENCNRIGLTTLERYAMIAHELGHLFLVTDETDLQKELRADEMACRLGLRDAMRTGLEKILADNLDEETIEQIRNRIDTLSEDE
ncbi:hypothetical protein [Phocaeicola salanitronis]|uniref:hypothetical protein n=1 Tax=Phocaeicola salanitronis TaxID=376805 RepID=UPI0025A3A395|nr:hypothetical protein [Phocaeicola salanitronis]MDM8305023.1 hypothetical protein [Phocaeicola salanitronis]